MSRKHNIQQLILQHNRRLQKLKEKEAQYGMSVDSQVLIEIEDLEEKIGKLRKELQNLEQDSDFTNNRDGGWGMGLPTKQIIVLSGLAVIACIILGGAISAFWLYRVQEKSFSYLVRLQEENTGQNVANANVTIEVLGQAPLDGITDAKGVARILVPASYSGKPGRLLVEADLYESYRQEIDLTEVTLPDTILLKPSLIGPTPTDTDFLTQTPLPTDTPPLVINTTSTDTAQPLPTNTPTDAVTTPQKSTPTPTSTPILLLDGLTAYYPFNGNANDETKNGNGGIVYGATLTTDRFGNENSAYYFDGVNDYIVSSANSSLGTIYTVSLWFTSPLQHASDGNGFIFFRGKSYECYYEPAIAFSSQNMLEASLSGCDRKGHFGSVNLSPNTWHHIVVVVKGSFQELYIDNNLIALNNKRPESISMKFFIGAGTKDGKNPTPNPGFFSGTIDDIRLYNRALTEEEIQLLHHEGGWGD